MARRTTVVIVDDHKILRDGLRTVLQGVTGIEIAGEAGNGRHAVQLVRRLAPDVVVMDVAMPDLNGIEATRQIREAGVETKVLALSMHSDSRYVKGMLQAGAAGYILKDCAAEELALAIQTVVSNRIYVSPGIAGVIVRDYVQYLSSDAAPRESALSSREREVLQLLAEGKSTADTANRLHVSVKTIETHRRRVMQKLGIDSIPALTKYAIREGIISLYD
ncbi:MAG: response regulator transcription factor [Gammaproteobacteria bacterium]|nr:response regulator transcription factor [Gammaproteobacteria bacterium]